MRAFLRDWMMDLAKYGRVVPRALDIAARSERVDYATDEYRQTRRRLMNGLHPERMTLCLRDVIPETPTSRTLVFQRTDGPKPPFRPGQYVNLFVEVDGVRTSRPYSISSSPESPFLSLTVRQGGGRFVSRYLTETVAVGDTFESTGPAGQFYYERLIDPPRLVFLAGGSGITPFMSMIRHGASAGWPYTVELLYGCRTPKDVIFGEELSALAREHEEFRYHLVISEPPRGYKGNRGFLDGRCIRKLVDGLEGKKFFLCGPNAMYELRLQALARLGVAEHRVRRELFGPPEDVTLEPGWPAGLSGSTLHRVVVEGHGEFDAPAGEPLLNALERNGVVVPAVCRSGECSACRMKRIEGRVFLPAQARIRQSDAENGYIHACVAYPIGPIRVRL